MGNPNGAAESNNPILLTSVFEQHLIFHTGTLSWNRKCEDEPDNPRDLLSILHRLEELVDF